MNSSVGIRFTRIRLAKTMMNMPIRPMSWVSGIQDSDTSSSQKPAAAEAPRALARMLPCVSTTPLGSLVEPEENWMKATSSGPTCATVPGRPTSSISSIRKLRARSESNSADSPTSRAKPSRRSSVLRSVYR